jgi:hypothetical protein
LAHKVLVNSVPAGTNGVELPDGFTYKAGATPVLTDEQFSLLDQSIFTDGTLTDLGELGPTGDSVTTQSASVTLTSSQLSTTGSGTELTDFTTLATAYNKLQADVVALQTSLSGAGKAIV